MPSQHQPTREVGQGLDSKVFLEVLCKLVCKRNPSLSATSYHYYLYGIKLKLTDSPNP